MLVRIVCMSLRVQGSKKCRACAAQQAELRQIASRRASVDCEHGSPDHKGRSYVYLCGLALVSSQLRLWLTELMRKRKAEPYIRAIANVLELRDNLKSQVRGVPPYNPTLGVVLWCPIIPLGLCCSGQRCQQLQRKVGHNLLRPCQGGKGPGCAGGRVRSVGT